MSKNLKISIITICFNSSKTIEETINSVLKQKDENVEYIIVDAVSTDGTLDIINRYKDKIDIVVSEKDNGISDAFNKGIRLSSGEIIGIINSDDILCENAISALRESFEDDIDVYRGNVLKWNSVTGNMSRSVPSVSKKDVYKKFTVAHPGTFISKRAYMKHGMYDLNCKTMMDYDLLLRYINLNLKFKYINADLACFRIGGITSNQKKVFLNTKKEIGELKYVLKKNDFSKGLIFKQSLISILRNTIKYIFKLD